MDVNQVTNNDNNVNCYNQKTTNSNDTLKVTQQQVNEVIIQNTRTTATHRKQWIIWRLSNVKSTPLTIAERAQLVRLLVLPLLVIFLLPTIRLDKHVAPVHLDIPADVPIQLECSSLEYQHHQPETLITQLWQLYNSGLVESLIRLPFDRLRLQAGGLLLMGVAETVIPPVGPKVLRHQQQPQPQKPSADLQEEETHMLMLAPAEHRANGPIIGATGGYQYERGVATNSGPASSEHTPAEYGAQIEGGGEHAISVGGGGAGEATIVSESAGGVGGQTSALQARADLPAVRALNVKCEKNHMTVNIVFDRPFYGLVFSKGHYNDQKCVHLAPNSGQSSINFDIHLGKCGMSSSDAGPPLGSSSSAIAQQQSNGQQQQPNGVYIENTIIIQYDPLVQEIYDQARKLRCTWYDYYEKSVTFRPYNVDMLDAVTANFLGDNIQCWMQIQVGKGPWSSEVAGIVKIGQTMTMVLAIKDDENRFDMLVRNCVAHDGKHQPIQLVDEYGCVARPKIMGKFQKVRNFGPAATVVSYAHFQAFKFPDSMSVHFQCVIQVCRFECPEPVCNQPGNVGGELASVGGQASPQPQGGDYATSGTEMIASKEPGSHFTSISPYGQQQQQQFIANHSQNNNAIQLKLDESQGRVQVKLDTSMMAGHLAGAAGASRPGQVLASPAATAAASGPLPPHLLHMAPGGGNQEQQQPLRPYLSSAYYRPQTVTSGGVQLPPGGATNGRPMASPTNAGGRPAHLMAPPGGAHSHYSTQFGSSQSVASKRSTYANRLGDLPELLSGADSDERHQLAPPYEADYSPLSLIALPRGLKLGTSTRVKRQITSGSSVSPTPLPPTQQSGRQARHLRADSSASTSVQTQKTIQVVSPDDVAFSLLDPSEDPISGSADPTIGTWRSPLKRPPTQLPPTTSVCFSTARLMWGLLVTLAALASSIVIATYVILKQRSQLDRKLASVFVDSSSSLSDDYDTRTPPQHVDLHQQQQQILAAASRQQHNNSAAYCTRVNASHISHHQRQQEELAQRNTYLSRLYSQFAPANYWR